MTPDEFHECDAVLRSHPTVIEALGNRGIDDMDLVLFDTWAYGAELVPERYRGRRIAWADVWRRNSPEANPYANMLSGLHPVVDLNAMELLELEDVDPGPAPHVMGEYDPRLVPGLRPRQDIKPLDITQPDGPSFKLDGNQAGVAEVVDAARLQLPRGSRIHLLVYDDAGRPRQIAHRLSFAEMVVPYRDPTPDHYRRTAFDIGEWGLGLMTTSLELGCDCLGEIAYLDAVLPTRAASRYTIKNAICIHEEDDGVLWKHVDERTGAETRRMRRLVVSFHATVANYEYLVYWRFYQDGNIQCEVRATGIMVTTPFAGDAPPYGTRDRRADVRAVPPALHRRPARPRRRRRAQHRVRHRSRPAARATATGSRSPSARRRYAPSSRASRTTTGVASAPGRSSTTTWRTGSAPRWATSSNPSAAIPALLEPDSPVVRRAQAIEHTLWVTPYSEDERWPCGEFPNLSAEDPGCRCGRRATGRSRTPTSCSGTCSGSTTSPGPRTGR